MRARRRCSQSHVPYAQSTGTWHAEIYLVDIHRSPERIPLQDGCCCWRRGCQLRHPAGRLPIHAEPQPGRCCRKGCSIARRSIWRRSCMCCGSGGASICCRRPAGCRGRAQPPFAVCCAGVRQCCSGRGSICCFFASGRQRLIAPGRAGCCGSFRQRRRRRCCRGAGGGASLPAAAQERNSCGWQPRERLLPGFLDLAECQSIHMSSETIRAAGFKFRAINSSEHEAGAIQAAAQGKY